MTAAVATTPTSPLTSTSTTTTTIKTSDDTAHISSSSELYHEEYSPPFLPVLLMVPFLVPVFWHYSVTVCSDTLSFGYSRGLGARKTVSRSGDMVAGSAEVIPHIHGLRDGWGGWGIRMKFSNWNEIGYIAKNGPGIRIRIRQSSNTKDDLTSPTTNTKETIYIFNCDNPEKVCQILNSKDTTTTTTTTITNV